MSNGRKFKRNVKKKKPQHRGDEIEAKLTALIKLRHSRGIIESNEQREVYLISIFDALYGSGVEFGEIMQRLEAFNQLFVKPFEYPELRSMVSAWYVYGIDGDLARIFPEDH